MNTIQFRRFLQLTLFEGQSRFVGARNEHADFGSELVFVEPELGLSGLACSDRCQARMISEEAP